MKRSWVALMLVLVAACGGSPPTPQAPSPPHGSVPLYRLAKAGAHLIVMSNIGGHELPLIVDTGVGTNVLSAALAWYLQLARSPANIFMVDMVGVEAPLVRVDCGLSLPPFRKSELFAGSLPRLRRVGHVGMVSPQSLASAGEMVVLDLANGTLALASADEATGAGFGLKGEICRGQVGWAYLVDAVVAGHPTRLLVDTGTPSTTLDGRAPAGRALLEQQAGLLKTAEAESLPDEEGAGVGPRWVMSGSATRGERMALIPGQRVDAGGTSRSLDVVVAPNGLHVSCHADGYLGLDFLSGCVFLLTHEQLLGRCGAEPVRPVPLKETALLPPLVFAGIRVDGACPGVEAPAPLGGPPARYQDPLEAWQPVSERARAQGEAYAAACTHAGYLRADVRIDLRLDADRRNVWGQVSVTPGPRFRTGPIRLISTDGSPPPIVPLTRLRENDWYDPSRLAEQIEELNQQLAPDRRRVSGSGEQIDDAGQRVDVVIFVARD
jgi:hypothetical protein